MADKTSKRIRCFIALLLPEEIKKKAVEVQNRLRKANADVKWVEKENLHITLRFLGEIEEEKVEKVKRLMEEVG
ncbi:MAG: RNA 2',3'-cyclic phosphodiesterase, partial [bacterium]